VQDHQPDGIGYNNINVEEATRQGIPVAVVWMPASMKCPTRPWPSSWPFPKTLSPGQAVRKGIWKAGSMEIVKVRGQMFRLNQQTLGLVGVGRIGSMMPSKAEPSE